MYIRAPGCVRSLRKLLDFISATVQIEVHRNANAKRSSFPIENSFLCPKPFAPAGRMDLHVRTAARHGVGLKTGKREANTMSATESEKRSLYERLGGVYSIATVVEDLIDRVMSDARLNANPLVDEAHHKVPPAGFKYLVTEMLCWAAGGPQHYSGRSMEESHRGMAITPGEWQAFMEDVQITLNKFSVPVAEQVEVKALVESTRAAIVSPAA